MKAKVILLKAKQNTVLRGHPWIFPKAIAKTHGKLITGHLIDIYSAEEELIGVGIYNEHSLYRVRVLALSNESLDTSNLHTLITHRLNQAKQVRDCLSLPNEETTAYRLFNSEADGLSGLTIDRFNQNCVVASSAYWVELNREVIINALKNLFPADQIIWMPQSKPLSQDGWKQISVQEQHYNTKVLEAGVIYEVEFAQAQKTGLFLDQRENHQRIAQLSKGKKYWIFTATAAVSLCMPLAPGPQKLPQ